MTRVALALALLTFPVLAQEVNPNFRLRVASLEETHEDADHTVVHFVTNRLIANPTEGKPEWSELNPDKMFLSATEKPLMGWTLVKRDKSPDVENDSNLEPFTIEKYEPWYRVRVLRDDTAPPFIKNEITKDGMDFLGNLWRRDVLIYVHGFNNDWATAIRRAAQLKRDFKKLYKRDFSIVVYSWPAMGGLPGVLYYSEDQSRYRQSLPAISKFLDAILLKDGKTEGRGKRWVLAHSMGNRVFLHGFAEMGRRAAKQRQQLPKDLFTRIVLAAPDMEVKDFEEHADYVFRFCASPKPVMYFHATSNIAVNASELEHFDDRAGVKPVVSQRLLTIDAKAAKSPLSELGHGYYASNDKMLTLIANYFFAGADPAQSPDIESVDGKRWRLK